MSTSISQTPDGYLCPHGCGYTSPNRRSVASHMARCPRKNDPVALPPPSLRKGKKSIPWQEDPDILKRLILVEDLDLAGYRNYEIAKKLKITEGTVRLDKARIAELYRTEITREITDRRNRSIANMRRIQRQAEIHYTTINKDLAAFRVQMDAEKEIIALEGTRTPVDQNINIKNNTPLEGMTTADLLARAASLQDMAARLLEPPSDS